MFNALKALKKNVFYRLGISLFTLILTLNFLNVSSLSYANAADSSLNLPAAGSMIGLTKAFEPVVIKGININTSDPLKFDFIIDEGTTRLDEGALTKETTKLMKYFLASLTIPDQQMWVNLSPYEKDRVISGDLQKTEMGRDLLAEDYILKQLGSSLSNPRNELGRQFWQRVYSQIQTKYSSPDALVGINTFNKIWIIPDKATIYEHKKGALILNNRLKVMMEEDYLAMKMDDRKSKIENSKKSSSSILHLQSSIFKEIIIPEIEKEVNFGQNFAPLRQIYNSMVIATWYKENLKTSLLGKVYVDKAQTDGIELNDPQMARKIYDKYMEVFRKGSYNFIQDEYDPRLKEIVPRQYFSGGFDRNGESAKSVFNITPEEEQALNATDHHLKLVSAGVDMASLGSDASMVMGGEDHLTDILDQFKKYQESIPEIKHFIKFLNKQNRQIKTWINQNRDSIEGSVEKNIPKYGNSAIDNHIETLITKKFKLSPMSFNIIDLIITDRPLTEDKITYLRREIRASRYDFWGMQVIPPVAIAASLAIVGLHYAFGVSTLIFHTAAFSTLGLYLLPGYFEMSRGKIASERLLGKKLSGEAFITWSLIFFSSTIINGIIWISKGQLNPWFLTAGLFISGTIFMKAAEKILGEYNPGRILPSSTEIANNDERLYKWTSRIPAAAALAIYISGVSLIHMFAHPMSEFWVLALDGLLGYMVYEGIFLYTPTTQKWAKASREAELTNDPSKLKRSLADRIDLLRLHSKVPMWFIFYAWGKEKYPNGLPVSVVKFLNQYEAFMKPLAHIHEILFVLAKALPPTALGFAFGFALQKVFFDQIVYKLASKLEKAFSSSQNEEDNAIHQEPQNGGIDLASNNLNLIRKGERFRFEDVSQPAGGSQNFSRLRAVPVIYRIKAIENLNAALGF